MVGVTLSWTDDALQFLRIALILDAPHNAHFSSQQLLFRRTTDVPPLTLILGRVGERVNYVDEMRHSCEESAELGETFKALRVYHISGNMCETCHHLGTHFGVNVGVDEVISLLKLR